MEELDQNTYQFENRCTLTKPMVRELIWAQMAWVRVLAVLITLIEGVSALLCVYHICIGQRPPVDELASLIIGLICVAALWTVPGKSAKAAVIIAAIVSISGSLLSLFHDLFISLLNLFEFLLSLLFVWIVNIGIRMVLSAQFAVCFLHFIIGCVSRNPKYTIRIDHSFFSPDSFLCLWIISKRTHTPE